MFCNVRIDRGTDVYICVLRRDFIGHRFDNDTPVAETVSLWRHEHKPLTEKVLQMQALHDVVQLGYVRYIGMSSCWAWQCKY
jgi:aryl-alcohol dehydrogenase-like predicted oxidoreductase